LLFSPCGWNFFLSVDTSYNCASSQAFQACSQDEGLFACIVGHLGLRCQHGSRCDACWCCYHTCHRVGSGKHGHKDKWGCNKPEYRHKVTIRASKNETDDISADLLWAFHKANRGGTVYLKEGSTYVIGKKLDLSFLNDVHLQLDGELKFTDDIKYWQANNFYYDFQKSITWVVWGGEKIKIYTNTGTGVLNGNGQAW
jgi:hypothetical protein